MRVKIEKGEISFNVSCFLDNLDEETKSELIENLACQDDIIKRVADQIFDGWTEKGSHGPKLAGATEDPKTGLDYAMRKFSKLDELAKKEIVRLESALTNKTSEVQCAYKKIAELRWRLR